MRGDSKVRRLTCLHNVTQGRFQDCSKSVMNLFVYGKLLVLFIYLTNQKNLEEKHRVGDVSIRKRQQNSSGEMEMLAIYV